MPSDPSGIISAFLATGSLPLSRSVSRVQTMLNRADYDAADLAEHLRMDSTLAAKVMAVANSAFFSRQPCSSTDEAVNRLGTVQLKRIFAQVLAGAVLMTPLRAYGLAADAMWRRSVFAAVGSELAALRKGDEGSSAYTVGLLHQIGMLVVNTHWQKSGRTVPLVRINFEEEFAADETKLCGFDQSALGAELLKQLSFPEEMYRIIARQYRPALEPTAQLLYLGRFARAFLCDGISPTANSNVLQNFKLTTTSHLDSFLTDVRQEGQDRIKGS